MTRRVSVTLLAVMATWVALGPASAGIPGLLAAATKRVRSKAQFSRAVGLEVDGRPSKGETTTASEVNRLRFVFDNPFIGVGTRTGSVAPID